MVSRRPPKGTVKLIVSIETRRQINEMSVTRSQVDPLIEQGLVANAGTTFRASG
jgi:hypothetical protein